jgi:hypothetical protein
VTRRRFASLLICLAAVALWAVPAAGALAQSPLTNSGGTALSPNGNAECLKCHGVQPVDGKITVDGQTYPATVDVNGEQKSTYVD